MWHPILVASHRALLGMCCHAAIQLPATCCVISSFVFSDSRSKTHQAIMATKLIPSGSCKLKQAQEVRSITHDKLHNAERALQKPRHSMLPTCAPAAEMLFVSTKECHVAREFAEEMHQEEEPMEREETEQHSAQSDERHQH